MLVFQWKVRAKEFYYQLQFYYRWTSFAGFFFIFWQKVSSIAFKYLLLFIAFTQVVFTEKVSFIKTTAFNYSFTDTWSIQIYYIGELYITSLIIPTKSILPLLFGHSLLKEYAWCNTLCSNGISLNVNLVLIACHWIVSR